ncbi:MAG: DUF4301 family protein [Bacteroides sp.]|nr:DUF4301 family protein [Bacteroides sp.]
METLSPSVKDQLISKGIKLEQIENQLRSFAQGFPFLRIESAASPPNDILQLRSDEEEKYVTAWESYKQTGKRLVKFVPASGAASRMFKDLFAFLEADYVEPTTEFETLFFHRLKDFAFYNELSAACVRVLGQTVEELLATKRYKDVIHLLLGKRGLNYGALPKGLLSFHQAGKDVRTPLEEHLVEGALYAAESTGDVRLHFTVSAEHRPLFADLIARRVSLFEKEYGVSYKIELSEQKPSTDTVAVDEQNKPFCEEGRWLFRPGGHGALIENLNDLEADIIFIKNIDNVVPDEQKGDTVAYKKILAGLLVELQAETFAYLRKLDQGSCSRVELNEMLTFLEYRLGCRRANSSEALTDKELTVYLRDKLNRPLRVCGMVKNVGEPGGGPFRVWNADGTTGLQILESSQIDMNDLRSRTFFEQGTHFNPVDLVCGVCDYQGNAFDLTRFIDPETGFISHKSKNGRELKALELPGLWNGAMSHWNTVFVEVPISTFNPVKTVNDLLRSTHQ